MSQKTTERACSECGQGTETLTMRNGPVQRGTGDNRITVYVTVPVWECDCCRIPYTDGDAEVIREEAVRLAREAITNAE